MILLPVPRWRWALALALLAGCEVRPPPALVEGAAAPPATAGAPALTRAAAVAAPPAAAESAAAPPAPPPPPDPPIALASGGARAVRGDAGLVTSVEAHATRAGADVLRSGGNAVDAAVAVAFALAVTHPSAGNIGGGGFMMIRLASGETHAVDFREAAPASVTTEAILAMVRAGGYGYTSAGVPGSVAGLAFAHERFGSRPLAELLAPAIALARKGHRLGARQALTLRWAWPRLRGDRAASAIWGRGKAPLVQGDLVRQLDLARTLEAIAAEGPRAFYEGPIARKIAGAMRERGGHIAESDLGAYQAKLRAPLRFSYRGFTVDTMPPPSMGGVAFAEIMLTLERLKAHEAPAGSGLSLHLFVEAAKRAYADRRKVSADPDFTAPGTTRMLAMLLDGGYLMGRKPPVDPERATPAGDIAPIEDAIALESPQTTHFAVIDAQGNAVSCTTTQSASFGAKIVIPGTGILLGNALGAFSETGINAVAPGKRMASSMTPTIVSRGGKAALLLGSPGGDTIPNTVAQVLRNLVDHGMTIDEAVRHPRIHHQWLPDRVRVEQLNPPPKAALDDLVRRGHVVAMDPMPIGDANNVLIDGGGVAWGYADTREGGTAEGVAAAGKLGPAAQAGAPPPAASGPPPAASAPTPPSQPSAPIPPGASSPSSPP
ncbi:gamma-glutamyltransferase [Sorangium cellulosum]|uniref:Glutathione hydrolase proenzyme n=1 Tax=Sorangium cellulosum TaxID=56 RepID=A0A2L0F9B0_SORCE|nr:gamma-glutamyltransferase [Sorangium cellulosum]AUX48150.1 gamma-glutamyltransferase [Sorangium cellulosum]